MRFLVAIALLTLAVASAHHTPYHTLRGPRFQPGRVYRYDIEYNVTSGVLGLSSQVSKAAIKAEAHIYAKNAREHILKIEKVYTSGSVKAVDGKHSDIPMQRNTELGNRLSVPIKFTLENGEVTSYTLSPRENLESKKIKKSILRSLEMHVSDRALQQMESETEMRIPVTYNTTETTDSGLRTIHYMIAVSPYAEFPYDQNVFNLTRSDDFEAESYPSYKVHHNFQQQGCPEVCRKDWRSNEYGAGCPMGYEPHHSPIKMSFNHEHHLSLLENIMNPEIIKTSEVHVAQMFDQDMEVLIKYQMRRKKVSNGEIVEPTGQKTYTDLKDMTAEINEKEIDELCGYKSSAESIDSIEHLLKSISEIIVNGRLEDDKSKIIGQKIILLKNAMIRLTVQELEKVMSLIRRPTNIPNEDAVEKVKRQIFLDILPIIGTEEAVTFITQYIKSGLLNQELLIWEAKELLESLPQNIHKPTERNVRDLLTLVTEGGIREKVRDNHLLHSATHLTIARVLGRMCGNSMVVRSKPAHSSSWFSSYHQSQDSPDDYEPVRCSEELVDEIFREMTQKLERAEKKEDIAVYLETLAHIGAPAVLPVISEYVYGTAENLQKYSPSYIDFVKTVSLYALHNVAAKLPEEVLQIVLPVFFNGTETPKVRNAAFGVLIRCQPSLEILQHIAIRSWSEESKEVGSYVTSTMESFGNSTLPCMQLTSHRIKKVLPQLKRFDIGVHHAKNFLWSYFDEQRDFGLESRLEYTPSNASFIPSALYKSLSYSTDSLRDVLMQMALNVQGLTREMIWKSLEKILDLKPMISFNTRRERDIFGDAHVESRIPEDLRFTIYKRIFYCTSYNYFDKDTSRAMLENLAEYLRTYLKKSHTEYDGHLVKMFLPSTYHTVAIAKTLPYPVEFEMKQPLVLAVKVKSLERSPKASRFHMHIRPSVYYTKLFTHQIKNLGDCKEVGVYHEHKMAFAYPFELKFRGINFPNVTLKYKKPELNKQVFTYYSEAGTYAAKKQLEILPSTANREPIVTQPTPFQFEKAINIVGVPPVRVQMRTEDITWNIENIPRNVEEALEIVLRKVNNAGWRQSSLVLTHYEDSKIWPRETEITLNFEYHREHIARYLNEPHASLKEQDESEWAPKPSHRGQRQEDSPHKIWRDTPKEEDWAKDLKPNDIPNTRDPETYIEQGKKAHRAMYLAPHMSHVWKMEVESTPLYTSGYVHLEYNHTYSKILHSLHMDAAVKPSRQAHKYEVTMDHIVAFFSKPNEFEYHRHPEDQKAIFITALGLPHGSENGAWEKVETIFKGVLSYESLEELLKEELLTRVDPKYFLPEAHETCIEDLKEGKALSIECLKATRENSIYNQLYMTMLWKEEVPEVLKTIARRVDLYTKHFLFHHMNMTEEKNIDHKVTVWLNHIDKFVDEPVFDFKILKPTETVEFRRVPTKGFQPLNSIYNVMETTTMESTNNTYPATCNIMKNYVRTYDLKTYRFTTDKCNYVLTTHCARHKYFAITVKGLEPTRGTKEITIYVADKTVVLTPRSGNEYTLKYNNQEVTIKSGIVLSETHEIYAYPEYTTTGPILRVVAKRAGINVLYDGINVKVKVDPMYKGELCGLCSEFDGEELREYRGVDQCLYNHPIDFANSAITKREGQCEKTRVYGQKICYGEENTVWKHDNDNDDNDDNEDDSYDPPMKRNVVESRGNEFCFSILPVPVCEDNKRPMETEHQKVSFHCLPKNDITAKKLITESKRRVLGELASKDVDFEETLDVAKMC